MALTYVPINEIEEPLRVALGLSGPSGTGKTYSGLRMARGMAREIDGPKARFGLLDTEDGRGRHYRGDFPDLLYRDFRARDRKTGEVIGFPVDRWLAALDDADREGIKVLVVDTASHSWEGVNGVLDRQAKRLAELTGGDDSKADRLSQLAWAEIKPDYRRLVERLTGAEFHVVVCSRAKPVMQKRQGGGTVNARSNKIRNAAIPWDIAGDADLIFNMTAQLMLNPERAGRPGWIIKCPDGLRPLFDPDAMLDENLGKRLIQWAKGDDESRKNKEILDAAREVARKGREAFNAYFRGLPEPDKFRVRSIEAEIKDTLDKMEARGREDREGFTRPEDDKADGDADA